MARKITLTRGFEATIDDADYDLVSKYKWRVSVSNWGTFAVTWMQIEGRGRHVYLHHFLLGFPTRKHTKFINGDTLDCRRCNLRAATGSEIQAGRSIGQNNKSGYKGVSFNKASGKYKAYIKQNGKLHHLGLFPNAIDAARAYNRKACELLGEFARLNDVPE
jgi:hypothetical protein